MRSLTHMRMMLCSETIPHLHLMAQIKPHNHMY